MRSLVGIMKKVGDMKFLVDEDIVVVAAETDATVSLITDVSMVQQ